MKIIKFSEAEELKGEGYVLHRLVNPVTTDSKYAMSFLVTVEAGGQIPEHQHGPAEVALHVLEGSGLATISGESERIGPNMAVYVPVGATIGLNNDGDAALRMLAVLSPPISVNICQVCGIEIDTI